MILFIGATLLKSSIEKCVTPTPVVVNAFTYAVLGVSIALKLFQMLVYIDFSKAISSSALKASAQDSRNDALTTLGVLVSAIIIGVAGDKIDPKVSVDGIMGIIVSLFIIVSSISLLKGAVSPLLGEKPPKELVDKITDKILSYDGVIGVHDLVVHSYGASHCFAIAARRSARRRGYSQKPRHHRQHRARYVGRDARKAQHTHGPRGNQKTEQLALLKQRAQSALSALDESVTLHDFRMVKGESHTKSGF